MFVRHRLGGTAGETVGRNVSEGGGWKRKMHVQETAKGIEWLATKLGGQDSSPTAEAPPLKGLHEAKTLLEADKW